MKRNQRPSQRQMALYDEPVSELAIPPDTREAIVEALADLLLEALERQQIEEQDAKV